MKKRRPIQEPDSSTFADIAFLLLIFFMVVTTFNKNYQVEMTLPPLQEEKQRSGKISKDRLVNIYLNNSDQLLVNDKILQNDRELSLVEEIQRITSGKRNGIIKINMLPDTKYEDYLKVLNAIKKSRIEVKQKIAQLMFDNDFEKLSNTQKNVINNKVKYSILEKEIEQYENS